MRGFGAGFDDGSSIRIHGDSIRIDRAIATRRCCPPPDGRPAGQPVFMSGQLLELRRFAHGAWFPIADAAHLQTETDVIKHDHARKQCFYCGSTSIRWSSSKIPPPLTGCEPATQFGTVDLPQPDRLSNTTNSPRWIVRSSSSSAAIAQPCAFVKVRLT